MIRRPIRRGGWSVVVAAALCLPARAQQTSGGDPELAPLAHGTLTVWIVHPAAAAAMIPPGQQPAKGTARVPGPMVPSAVSNAPLSTEYHEQTAGSFGTPSGSVGETSGGYGQPASTLGQPASEHGHPASEHGQPASTLGTAASNVGQTAGTYGQPAGSFGESLSTLATAGETQARNASAATTPGHGPEWAPLLGIGAEGFPGLDLRVADVRMDELPDLLARTAGTAQAPDVLAGDPLPAQWEHGLAQQRGLAVLGTSHWWAQGVRAPQAAGSGTEIAILRSAPHPAQARAFAVWVADGGVCSTCGNAPRPGPEQAAVRTYMVMLTGGGLAAPDRDAAVFDPALSVRALVPRPVWLGTEALGARVSVERSVQIASRGGPALALVAMRAVVRAGEGFGILHGYAVLRAEGTGANQRWRTLQLSPNAGLTATDEAAATLTSVGAAPAAGTRLQAVSLAAPPDGDVRSPQPDLWWDPGSGASAEVLEWQPGGATGDWESSRLLWLADRDPHQQVRVTASFAGDGLFRWRVWSIAPGGRVALSPWRSFRVVR